ncbi:hypothetical protein BHE74_00034538 [Ensete ventricosum]|nr:hypothetical protein BHE74_00034538 [Ensete ventricosum]
MRAGCQDGWKDAKAGDNYCCYLEVWEQDARAGGEGCCYHPTWEQDAKMVGCHKGASEREEPIATRLARGGRSKGDNGWPAVGERKLDDSDRNENVQEPATGSRQQEQVCSGLGEHGRRLREVDLCSRSLRGGGVVAIGRDVLTVEIEQRGRE